MWSFQLPHLKYHHWWCFFFPYLPFFALALSQVIDRFEPQNAELYVASGQLYSRIVSWSLCCSRETWIRQGGICIFADGFCSAEGMRRFSIKRTHWSSEACLCPLPTPSISTSWPTRFISRYDKVGFRRVFVSTTLFCYDRNGSFGRSAAIASNRV